MLLVGVALFAAVMNGPTYHRLCMVAPPAIILFVWLFSGTDAKTRAVRNSLWVSAICTLLYLAVSRQHQRRWYLDLPTGRTAFIDQVGYQQTAWFGEQIRPGDTLFGHPQLSFAFSLASPTPLDFVAPNEFTRPSQVEAVLRCLEQQKVRFIFLYPEIIEGHSSGDNLGPFRSYLSENYHIVRTFPSGQFWERGSS